MSDTKRKPRAKTYSTDSIENFLGRITTATKGSVHVNGSTFQNALVTVDFGEPIPPYRLTGEQMQGLVAEMRSLALAVINRDVNVNIHSDNSRGIFWAAVV